MLLLLAAGLIHQAALADLTMVYTGMAVTVESYTDENGYFSWTFTRGTNDYLWGLSEDSHGIWVPTVAVQNVSDPPGWQSQIGGYVNWTYTNAGTWFIENEAITFSYQSEVAEPIVASGFLVGDLFNLDHSPVPASGYEWFTALMPIPEPPPSLFALLVFAAPLIAILRRRISPRSSAQDPPHFP